MAVYIFVLGDVIRETLLLNLQRNIVALEIGACGCACYHVLGQLVRQ